MKIRKIKFMGIFWEIEEETDTHYLLLYAGENRWVSKCFVQSRVLTDEIESITINTTKNEL